MQAPLPSAVTAAQMSFAGEMCGKAITHWFPKARLLRACGSTTFGYASALCSCRIAFCAISFRVKRAGSNVDSIPNLPCTNHPTHEPRMCNQALVAEPQGHEASLPCPNHHTHCYRFDELRQGGGSNQQPYFRALVFFNKKPGLTDDFFHEHWKSVHADLTMQVQDTGVLLTRYVQVSKSGPCFLPSTVLSAPLPSFIRKPTTKSPLHHCWKPAWAACRLRRMMGAPNSMQSLRSTSSAS